MVKIIRLLNKVVHRN